MLKPQKVFKRLIFDNHFKQNFCLKLTYESEVDEMREENIKMG